jgi:hypothetical protein
MLSSDFKEIKRCRIFISNSQNVTGDEGGVEKKRKEPEFGKKNKILENLVRGCVFFF